MNSTSKALIAAAIAVIFAGGLIFWQVKARKTGPVELTAEDMTVLAEEQPPQIRARLASDEQARKDFALEMRRWLALAEEAQTHGIDKTPDMKRQLELQRASSSSLATDDSDAKTRARSRSRNSSIIRQRAIARRRSLVATLLNCV